MKQRENSTMKTRHGSVLLLVLLGTFLADGCSPAAKPGSGVTVAPVKAETVCALWQPPTAKEIGSVKGDKLACVHYSVSNHLGEVWAFYAQKLFDKYDEKPPLSYSQFSGSDVTWVLTTREHDTARAVTLGRRGGGQAVIIQLSADAADAETLVSVTVDMH